MRGPSIHRSPYRSTSTTEPFQVHASVRLPLGKGQMNLISQEFAVRFGVMGDSLAFKQYLMSRDRYLSNGTSVRSYCGISRLLPECVSNFLGRLLVKISSWAADEQAHEVLPHL
jgi:hypothetical protein